MQYVMPHKSCSSCNSSRSMQQYLLRIVILFTLYLGQEERIHQKVQRIVNCFFGGAGFFDKRPMQYIQSMEKEQQTVVVECYKKTTINHFKIWAGKQVGGIKIFRVCCCMRLASINCLPVTACTPSMSLVIVASSGTHSSPATLLLLYCYSAA